MFNCPLLCPPFKSERCCVAKQLLAQPRFLKDALQELFSLSSDLCVQEQADMNQNDGERRKETGREWRFVRKGVWGRKNIAGIPDICRVQQSWQSPLIQRASLSPLLTFTRHPVTTLQSQAWKKSKFAEMLVVCFASWRGWSRWSECRKVETTKMYFFPPPSPIWIILSPAANGEKSQTHLESNNAQHLVQINLFAFFVCSVAIKHSCFVCLVHPVWLVSCSGEQIKAHSGSLLSLIAARPFI